MKVRARVKAPEYLPGWAKCCEESIANFGKVGELVIDLSDEQVSDDLCKFCFSSRGPRKGYGNDKFKKYMPIEALDLDEGPIENSEQPLKTFSQV